MLEFDLFAFPFAFVVEAVDGSHDVTIFLLSVVVWEQVAGFARDGYNIRRVVQINRFFVFKAVDDEIAGQFRVIGTLFRFPVQ